MAVNTNKADYRKLRKSYDAMSGKGFSNDIYAKYMPNKKSTLSASAADALGKKYGYGNAYGFYKAADAAADAAGAAGAGAGAMGKASSWFKGAGDKVFKPGGFFSKGGGLGDALSGLANPQLDYDLNNFGLEAYGKNIGKYLTIGNALYQGFNAAQGLQDLSEAGDLSEDTVADILTSAANSPTISYDLTADQLNTLRELKNGVYDDSVGVDDIDLLGMLGDAGMGALMGIGGGIPGIIVGALGGAINSGIGDLNQAQGQSNAELEALYQAVLESERQNNQLRKQRAYASLAR